MSFPNSNKSSSLSSTSSSGSSVPLPQLGVPTESSTPPQAGVKRSLLMTSPVAKVSRPTIVSSDDEEEETTLREWRDRNGALQSIEAAPVLPAAPVLLPAPVLLAAAVVAAVDDRIRDADGGLQARDWYGEKRNVRIWPLHPTEGPKSDAWLPYHERIHNGKTYRFFLPGDPDFGGFHNFGFPSDGSDNQEWRQEAYVAVYTPGGGVSVGGAQAHRESHVASTRDRPQRQLQVEQSLDQSAATHTVAELSEGPRHGVPRRAAAHQASTRTAGSSSCCGKRRGSRHVIVAYES